MTTDGKIRNGKLQYDINREAAKIYSADIFNIDIF